MTALELAQYIMINAIAPRAGGGQRFDHREPAAVDARIEWRQALRA
jgi:hypothetical protein